jgi:aminopeptidase N
MHPNLTSLLIAPALALASLAVRADTGAAELCSTAARWLAPADSSEHRKYAPNREIDILHLALDLTPDFKKRTIAGQVHLRFKPIAKPLRELRLDAVDLRIQTVTASEKVEAWRTDDKVLTITFADVLAPDHETTVTVRYSGEPRQGLYFRTPEMGYKPGDTHLFTQGEAIEARHWYPCYDAPNEKFTSEITCRVPEGMTVVANGRLVSEARDAATGLIAVRWLQDKPHVSYLLALVAGYFKHLEATHRDIPLTFYTPPSEFNEAASSFVDTADAMAFFEKETGVAYPWAKYAQVCVNDFVAGGMENTSLTILTDSTLFSKATENLRSSQGLMAHELAHQWFGDLVTCKDWSHIWLNEGFATFYALLYDAHKNGRDSFLYGLYNDARGFLDVPNDTKPIVDREFDAPMEQFGFRAYPKGSWVLHMLRSQLGEELYRRCIRTYLQRHQYQNVVTEDLSRVIEELSGRSFDQFFDQWVYHAHQPELDISYSWDQQTRLARLSVKQVQAISDKVLLFNFPLPVRFKVRGELVERRVTVKEKDEDFYFALPEAPELVRVDPDLTVLAKVRFQPPGPMLEVMLANTNDVMGRLLAVAQLSGRQDHDALAKLKSALNQDPFYGVRIEAAKGLRAAHTEEALEALLASTNQPDARVRRQVRADLRGFYDESVAAAARAALTSEKNSDILAEAIGTLGIYAAPETRATLTPLLRSDSFRNSLASAAVSALRAQNDPAGIAPLLEALRSRRGAFTSGGLANGLSTLAYLARNEDNKDAVREFLVQHVNDARDRVKRAALSALGELGDPKAIPVLETFTRAAKESPERQAAESALAAVRAARKPVDELRDLRNEVLGLQKENRDLRRQVDDLKKKFEAVVRPEPAPEPKKKPAPRKPATPGRK